MINGTLPQQDLSLEGENVTSEEVVRQRYPHADAQDNRNQDQASRPAPTRAVRWTIYAASGNQVVLGEGHTEEQAWADAAERLKKEEVLAYHRASETNKPMFAAVL